MSFQKGLTCFDGSDGLFIRYRVGLPETEDTGCMVLSQAEIPALTEPSKDSARPMGKLLIRSGLFFVRPATKTAPRVETFRKFEQPDELNVVHRV